MRLQPTRVRTTVTRGQHRRRPIALSLAGLTFALSDADARRLADQLIDATEENR